MSEKKRVYELANELGMAAKDVLAILIKEGYDVKTTSSSLLKSDADLVFSQIMADTKKKEAEAKAAKAAPPPPPPVAPPAESTDGEGDESSDEIHLKSPVTVRDLAQALDLKPNAVIVQLMGLNIFAAINQVLELDIVEKICARNGKRFVQERREKSNHPVFGGGGGSQTSRTSAAQSRASARGRLHGPC